MSVLTATHYEAAGKNKLTFIHDKLASVLSEIQRQLTGAIFEVEFRNSRLKLFLHQTPRSFRISMSVSTDLVLI